LRERGEMPDAFRLGRGHLAQELAGPLEQVNCDPRPPEHIFEVATMISSAMVATVSRRRALSGAFRAPIHRGPTRRSWRWRSSGDEPEVG
jgi:hypothetical protein